jgi:hypothetical protein
VNRHLDRRLLNGLVMQPSIAMPRLDAGNRIELPNQPAPYGTPAPEIGPILQVASDLTKDGYATNPEFGPMSYARRIGIGIAIAICAFGFTWFGAMIMLRVGSAAAIPALLATIGAVYWFWIAAGRTEKSGSCVYLGANGWTRNTLEKGKLSSTTLLYRDDMLTTTTAKDVFINGYYTYSLESIAFSNADGSWIAALVGTYHRAGDPGQHTLAVRTAIKLMAARRAPLAQQALAAGQQIVFPLADGNGPKDGALVLEQHVLSYFKHRGAQPLVIARNNIYLSLRQGFVDLTMRDSGIVLGTFQRETLSNFELLEALVA